MPTDIGINFRSTAGFVTDGLNETWANVGGYPITRGGFTFGWETAGLSDRDRNAGIDRRLAGLVFNGGAGGNNFRLDLPATGAYDIHAAFGDDSAGHTVALVLRDGTTTFATLAGSPLTAHFLDASGVDRTTAAWPGAEVSISRTFASTIIRVTDNGAGSGIWIAHLRVVDSAAGDTLMAQICL